MRWTREPLLHFVLLGGLLFGLYALVSGPEEPTTPSVSRTVTVTQADLQRLADDFRRGWRRAPTRDELGDLLRDHVAQELLFREALAAGLDRDDPVIRRRLVDKGILLARGAPAGREPTAQELRAWYQQRRHRFRRPARLWLEQRFVDPDRHRGDVNRRAAELLATLARGGSDEGDPSPWPHVLEDRTETQLAHLLGEAFARAAFAATTGSWQGPISSTRGLHLIRVQRREPEGTPPFEAIEREVRADWLTEQNRGLLESFDRVRPTYEIRVPPEVRRAVEGAPAVASWLR